MRIKHIIIQMFYFFHNNWSSISYDENVLRSTEPEMDECSLGGLHRL